MPVHLCEIVLSSIHEFVKAVIKSTHFCA
jgi:hypothetical protein